MLSIWARLRFCRLVNSQQFSFLKPFPKRQFLDSSKLKGSAKDNFKFDENGKKFSKQVENTVANGEIARFQCYSVFKRPVLKKRKKKLGLLGKE